MIEALTLQNGPTVLEITTPSPLNNFNSYLRITLGYERWDWTCRKANGDGGEGCREISSYDLGLSVKFEEIPLVWHHQNTSR